MSKVVKVADKNKSLEVFKLGLLLVWLIVALGLDFYYGKDELLFRVLGWMVWSLSFVLGLAVTDLGRQWIASYKAAVVEIKKVTWPSLLEVRQTTIMISICVVLVALVLWGIDSLLAGVVKYLSN